MLFGGDNPGDPLAQHLNSKHNSYLTHLLIFAYPSKKYKDFKGLLLALLEKACSDLGTLCATGVTGFDGEKWYPACVGFKLDMEWMAKSGSLTRSYQNVGETKEHACCHECDAGMPGVPFENVNANAEWVATRFNTIPWRVRPPWRNIPFDTARPAKFLRRDAFHIYRLGILRNFIGSCIYLLIYMDCFTVQGEGNAMAKCLDRAWGNLLLFCNAQNLRVDGVRGFTVLNLHASKGAFPWLGCKGSDSITLLKWLIFLARLHLSGAAGQNAQVGSTTVDVTPTSSMASGTVSSVACSTVDSSYTGNFELSCSQGTLSFDVSWELQSRLRHHAECGTRGARHPDHRRWQFRVVEWLGALSLYREPKRKGDSLYKVGAL
eukprot:s147_g8.t1